MVITQFYTAMPALANYLCGLAQLTKSATGKSLTGAFVSVLKVFTRILTSPQTDNIMASPTMPHIACLRASLLFSSPSLPLMKYITMFQTI